MPASCRHGSSCRHDNPCRFSRHCFVSPSETGAAARRLGPDTRNSTKLFPASAQLPGLDAVNPADKSGCAHTHGAQRLGEGSHEHTVGFRQYRGRIDLVCHLHIAYRQRTCDADGDEPIERDGTRGRQSCRVDAEHRHAAGQQDRRAKRRQARQQFDQHREHLEYLERLESRERREWLERQ